ncbi:Cytochrome c oxidase assembly protein cox15 [Exophiala dermatitidis]|uniref:Cytochrome c oxidase subunit XV assembly protein n=2 Tax=Exophiala dermatitidis TaxID=5970 RepID=H6C3I3_EXODN|nr:cytochrome c oxidase subunit XV assembly protein [Exophiala dermatitidis NIH/UT8656]KAJ4517144.1 Cytochrome c oxidase assembly protein cox15 [Exophiala dermatitidis]EHY58198.1 cytochrome c oxidase subunit XV assembly protein [Exophiala dermatitidis NIH/UT8656]KAJ4519678.1 Cytochrome c oxidase assembly protein cox15 [Exophiala dermatitidis]KAJ4534522.1 Cytochrome c oxidase assembly protein cox15 [Exophiala dermatitidis]KAJ4551135.1 Cytochrome c oxidase assembly protein cox15 [Exophiala derma
MLPASSGFARVLREAAPSLSKRFFDCSRSASSTGSRRISSLSSKQTKRVASGTTAQGCTSNQQHHRSLSSAAPKTQQTLTGRSLQPSLYSSSLCSRNLRTDVTTTSRFVLARTFVASSSARTTMQTNTATANVQDATVVGAAAEADKSESKSGKKKSSSFPDTSSNTVAYWLLASAASVFGIVVFGGLTRLTESGLSITEWKPVTGSLPPMSQEDWEAEFAKYRSSPEFKMLNSRMTLEEFKSIYWMEWIHRLWGRFIGLSFVVPAVYFVARKQVSRSMAWRLLGIAGLIGFQGFIGWWMVKSGLKDDLFAPGSHPRVSQYRLTAHLGTAFICYLAMLWSGLDILRTNKLLKAPREVAEASLNALRNPALKPFKRSVALLAGLVFITAMSGGLVAGLDAGLIYNEFPFMGLGLTPPKSELFDPFYSHTEDRSDLWWRNMLENPSLVQLDHRILATTTFTAVMALWAYSRTGAMKKILPAAAKKGVHGVVGFVCLQVILGITTLLYLVPTHLASAHQAGSLFLLTWTVVLGSRVWFPTQAARILAQRMQQSVGSVGTAGARNLSSSAAGAHGKSGASTVLAASMMPAVTAVGLLLSTNAENGLRSQLRSNARAQHADAHSLEAKAQSEES